MPRSVSFPLLALIALVLSSCGFSGAKLVKLKTVSNYEWILGTWESKRSRGSIYEQWTKLNDNELTGRSFTIRNTDTIVSEKIRLVLKPDGLYYIPVVKDQNEGKEVVFKSTSASKLQMIFENPKHDFPQKIQYDFISKDSMIAVISGLINGQARAQRFPMRKIAP